MQTVPHQSFAPWNIAQANSTFEIFRSNCESQVRVPLPRRLPEQRATMRVDPDPGLSRCWRYLDAHELAWLWNLAPEEVRRFRCAS